MTKIAGLHIEIDDLSSQGEWIDITDQVKSVSISNIGLNGPHSPNPSSPSAEITMRADTGYLDFSMASYPDPGNRIRVRAKGQLGKCLKSIRIGPAVFSSYQGSKAATIVAGQTWTLTWYARAQWDSSYNLEYVYIQTGAESSPANLRLYTNKWKQYTVTFTTTLASTFVLCAFAPGTDRNYPYQYIEIKNVSLSCPTVNGGLNILTNGNFTNGLTDWTVYDAGLGQAIISVVDDTTILFNGFIIDASKVSQNSSLKRGVLSCSGYDQRWASARMELPIQTKKRSSDLISLIVDNMRANPRASWLNAIRANGPRRWYRLGEASATVASDSGIDGLAATFVNSATVLVGQTLYLNGDIDLGIALNDASSQYLSVPTIDFSNRSWSVEAFINPTGGGPATPSFLGFDSAGNKMDFFVNGATYSLGVGFPHLSVSPANIQTSASFVRDIWVHVVYTYDILLKTLKIYLNNVLYKTQTGVAAFTASTPTVRIGEQANGTNYWRGGIDEVVLYDYALTAAQVSVDYLSLGVQQIKRRTFTPGFLFETGNQIFDIALDGMQSNGLGKTPAANAMDVVNQAVTSEFGYFWFDKDGAAEFKNYNWWFTWRQRGAYILKTATMNYELINSYSGGEVVNRAVITYRPRSIAGGALTTIAKITAPVQIPPIVSGAYGTTGAIPGEITINLPFRDSANNAIGGTQLTMPLLPNTNYKINERSDGNPATDYTTRPEVAMMVVRIGASDIDVKFKNYATGPLYVTELSVQGRAITQFAPVTVTASDQVSIDLRDEIEYSRALPFGSDSVFANTLAPWYLARYSKPIDEDTSLIFENTIIEGGYDLLTWEIGDNVDTSGVDNGQPAAMVPGATYAVPPRMHMITGISYYFEPGDISRIQLTLGRFPDQFFYAVCDSAYSICDLPRVVCGL